MLERWAAVRTQDSGHCSLGQEHDWGMCGSGGVEAGGGMRPLEGREPAAEQRALAIDKGDTDIIKDRQRKDPEMCRSEPGPSWHGREGPRTVDGSNQDGEGGPMAWALRWRISGQSSDTGHPAATSQAQ